MTAVRKAPFGTSEHDGVQEARHSGQIPLQEALPRPATLPTR